MRPFRSSGKTAWREEHAALASLSTGSGLGFRLLTGSLVKPFFATDQPRNLVPTDAPEAELRQARVARRQSAAGTGSHDIARGLAKGSSRRCSSSLAFCSGGCRDCAPQAGVAKLFRDRRRRGCGRRWRHPVRDCAMRPGSRRLCAECDRFVSQIGSPAGSRQAQGGRRRRASRAMGRDRSRCGYGSRPDARKGHRPGGTPCNRRARPICSAAG